MDNVAQGSPSVAKGNASNKPTTAGKRGNYLKLLWVGLIMYFFIFFVIDHIPGIKNIQYYCLSKCENTVCETNVKNLRDSNYWIHPELNNVADSATCKFTMWELSHLLFHVWVGYEYGIITSSVISIGFEILEHYVYNCGSILDLGWNLIGALIGIVIRKFLERLET